MKDSSTKEKIKEILTRGVEDIFVKESLEKKLESGKELRVKLGIDPTGSTIHLGRASVLRKAKAFQDLGHRIVLIVGDFTATIGDPSDKLEKRPMLTKEAVKKNMENYKDILGKIIDLDKVEIVYNSQWLSNLNLSEISELAESFSVQQMVARRNFKDRIDKGQEISLREFLYPLMQGYDSVKVLADIEIGGFDQLFNLKAGRIIQKHYSMPEQDVLTTQMLEGTDGRKMSTSWGNVINITDGPVDMFGKVMSIKDDLIEKYFVLCTDLPEDEIKEVLKKENPKDQKIVLAEEVVRLYHGDRKALSAKDSFILTFQKKEIPDNLEEVVVGKGERLSGILIDRNLVSSKTEWRRLVSNGAVHLMEDKNLVQEFDFEVDKDITIKIGKRRFIKIKVK